MTPSSKNIPSPMRVLRDSSPWIVKLGRLGYASKGVVYVVMGFLATEAAFGFGGRTTDSKGALRAIGDASFGKFALGVTMIGLFGYAVWRLASAFTDAEGRGTEPKGIALRIGDAVRGLAYASLGVWTFKFLTARHAGSGNQTRTLTDRVMGMPGGRWMAIAAGAGIIAYAIYQLHRAYSGKFLKRLDLTPAKSEVRDGVKRAGRFGISARGIVFGMIGVLLVRAGVTYDPSKAGGIRESLDALAREPMGRVLYGGVALGLIAFGLFEIATARYRVMRAV